MGYDENPREMHRVGTTKIVREVELKLEKPLRLRKAFT
jgi:hypothetical protein